MALLSTVYTSLGRLQRLLSSQGVTDFADHDDDGSADTDVVEDCINEATVELDMYLWRYEPADLANAEVVQRWCTFLAAEYLCTRRGNVVPDSIATQVERILAMLPEVADGKRNIRGVALKADLRPTMSNLRIDRRYRRRTVRVTARNSSNVSTTQQRHKQQEYGGLDWW